LSGRVLVGNSLGGGVAIQMTLDHPEFAERLVLMAPGCIEEQAEYFKMPGIAKMVSNFGGPDFNLDEQRRLIGNLVHPDFAPNIPDALVQERFAVARTQPKDVLMRMRTPNLGPRFGELSVPIFVMWGLNDEFCPESGARHFLDQLRRCALHDLHPYRTLGSGRAGRGVQSLQSGIPAWLKAILQCLKICQPRSRRRCGGLLHRLPWWLPEVKAARSAWQPLRLLL
jgi:pimeloyl-ACP methyl ester carboxylesterase